MLSQISAGVPLRTATPENANAAKPGTVSAIGAKSDASGQRVSVEIPRAQMLPARACGTIDVVLSITASTAPTSRSLRAGALLRYGGEVDCGHALEHFARKVRRRADTR
jgi:hypothetical protein